MEPLPYQEDMPFEKNFSPAEAAITSRSLADLVWRLEWRSPEGRHTEELFTQLNVWRDLDCCPPPLARDLPGKRPGENLSYQFAPGEQAAYYADSNHQAFPLATFGQGRLTPRLGRFYPSGLLAAFPGFVNPFRCTGVSASELWADFNHPLAGKYLDLTVRVAEVRKKKGDTGGQCQDWWTLLLDGPGQQVRWRGQATDFFREDPLLRQDDQEDSRFYAKPRLVSHIDAQAQATIQHLYGRLLRPGMRVLDLMSSWQSHLPATLQPLEVMGLGLNELELQHNSRLSSHVLHDLNLNPALPFAENFFDAVICTVSVEYLTRPLEVFAEIRRILKPGGVFALTFSNRWFPPKVVTLWTELLDFERLGLVMEYFLQTGGFTELETFTARGWPRPQDDRYYPQVRFADPVLAAWGRKQS